MMIWPNVDAPVTPCPQCGGHLHPADIEHASETIPSTEIVKLTGHLLRCDQGHWFHVITVDKRVKLAPIR